MTTMRSAEPLTGIDAALARLLPFLNGTEPTPGEWLNQAQADALAEQAVEAAEAHGAASREHDLTMDAHAEHAELYGPGPEAEAG